MGLHLTPRRHEKLPAVAAVAVPAGSSRRDTKQQQQMTPVATPPQTLQGAAAQVGKCGAAGTPAAAQVGSAAMTGAEAAPRYQQRRTSDIASGQGTSKAALPDPDEHGAAFSPGSGPEVPAPRHFRGRQFECMYTAAQSSWSLRIIPRILGSNDDHGQKC